MMQKESIMPNIGEMLAIELAEKGYQAINPANPFVCNTDAFIMGGYKFPHCSKRLLDIFNTLTLNNVDDRYEVVGQLRYYLLGIMMEKLLEGEDEESIVHELKDAIKDAPCSLQELPRKIRIGDNESFDTESKFIRNNYFVSHKIEPEYEDWWERKTY